MCLGNILINNGYLCWASNVTGAKKSSLNQDSNPGPHAYCASSLTTELLRPDLLSDWHLDSWWLIILCLITISQGIGMKFKLCINCPSSTFKTHIHEHEFVLALTTSCSIPMKISSLWLYHQAEQRCQFNSCNLVQNVNIWISQVHYL